MNKKWLPLLDRILVLQDWGPEFHPGTEVAIPEPLRAKQRPNTGTVVAVGPGQWVNGTYCSVALQVGLHVMFAPAETLTKVDHDGSEHLMMREQDVFLVLDNG
jgi:chaperonin GroES